MQLALQLALQRNTTFKQSTARNGSASFILIDVLPVFAHAGRMRTENNETFKRVKREEKGPRQDIEDELVSIGQHLSNKRRRTRLPRHIFF
jgi:hypothetical protein